MALDDLGAGDQRGDLLLLLHLPVDEGLDVGMVDVDDDHLGGAARRAARLDRAGGAVADLEEGHQAATSGRRPRASRSRRAGGEIRAGAGAVFEQARLAHPQIHDAALVDEIVGDRLDEAGVRLRMLVGRLRLGQLAGRVVDVVMALPRPIDAVGPVQAGVEPLRRIGRGHLARQHEAHLVEIGARVVFRVEIAALPAPIGPGAGEPVEHLLGGGLRAVALGLGQRLERLLVGNRAPQERRHAVLLDALQARGHAGLAEILLRQHVGGDLAPAGRHLERARARTPPIRRDCGSRSWSSRTRSPRKATETTWCTAVRYAWLQTPMLGGRTPAFDRVSGPPMPMSDVSTRADAHKVPELRAASASPRRRCALTRAAAARQTPLEPENRRAPRTPEHYDFVTVTSTACADGPPTTQYIVEKNV